MKSVRLQRKEIVSRLDALPPRSRLVLLVGALFLASFVWFQLWAGPLQERSRLSHVRLAQARAELMSLEAQSAALKEGRYLPADEQNRKLKISLGREISALDDELQTLTGGMISPREMAAFLEELLRQEHGLRLVRLENLGVTPLLPTDKGEAKEAPNLFRHTLRMEFEGNYLRALDYLKRLERLPKRLLWEEVEIQAGSDTNRIVLTLHTLSLRRGWISA